MAEILVAPALAHSNPCKIKANQMRITTTGGFACSDITYSDIAGIVIILFSPGPILLNKDHL